ncbi:ribose transport system substrate-binding protein [Microbacterium sp. BE35]|uniref:sugar ABC transporter substrate-binding protein n=1 Tax=Microbacterium sp. BE35 TaxID=2817773 RepID=UPI0028647479|nr:substrate-binding domain-containing protein [Microbacterium sp. BE35]MDR7188177.1 ribose transport system substrate-binding protein [Microbacterium sp. BE35]
MAAALALTACSTGGTQDDAGEVDSAYFASVQEKVEGLKAPQTDLPPTGGPEAVPNKSVVIVTITMAEDSAKRLTEALDSAAKAIGWDSTIYDGQGSATIANDKLQQAVTTRPDGIVLVALDKTTVGAGLAAADAAGIPVSCSFCWDLGAEDGKGPYADVEPSLETVANMGRASAEYAFVATDGHPRYLQLNDPSLSNLITRQSGLEDFIDECQSSGGDCKLVASQDFQVADATTTLPAAAATLARANPDFNVIWAGFDFAGLQIISGLRQAGLTSGDSTFLVSSGGDGANLKLIADGGYQKASTAISYEWTGYAGIDNLNRIFAGQEPIDQNIPIRLFDKSNAGSAQGAWISDSDFKAAYLEQWHG